MKKTALQRWALIVLLVARLVIGELGHAMPMMSHVESTSVESHQATPCGEHEAAGLDASSSTDSTEPHDCCKNSACECPCLHAPCISFDVAIAFFTHDAVPQAVTPQGLAQQRVSGVFRPPA